MKIEINKPCHENWNEMNPNEQGAFCLVCTKNVVDFTTKTIEEIKEFFSVKREGRTCGRFREEQLEELNVSAFIDKFLGWKYSKRVASMVALSVVLWLSALNEAKAQSHHKMGVVAVQKDTVKAKEDTTKTPLIMGKVAPPKDKKKEDPKVKQRSKNEGKKQPKRKEEEHGYLLGDVEPEN